MENYKKKFIEFLAKSNALKFGEFKLKSGRISPYFINTGMFKDGESITKLASYYASAIKKEFGENFDIIYGPAYKGIPLCVSTCMELSKLGINKEYAFNRKETKDHGDGGLIVGAKLVDKEIIIIDDVITAGTAVKETVELLKNNGNPKIKGIIISVNRKETSSDGKSAIKELEQNLKIKIFSIIDIDDIIECLHNKKIDDAVYLTDEIYNKIRDYQKKYGV